MVFAGNRPRDNGAKFMTTTTTTTTVTTVTTVTVYAVFFCHPQGSPYSVFSGIYFSLEAAETKAAELRKTYLYAYVVDYKPLD